MLLGSESLAAVCGSIFFIYVVLTMLKARGPMVERILSGLRTNRGGGKNSEFYFVAQCAPIES